MSASKAEIRTWLESSPKDVSHMIVVRDTFDYEDYPIYVDKGEDVQKLVDHYDNKPSSKTVEVYNLKMDHQKQLREKHSWHI
jgi:hypothetical protein